MKTYAPNTSNEMEYAAAIQVGAKRGPDGEQARWTFLLAVFFRVTALLWIVAGLAQWLHILSLTGRDFPDVSAAVVAAVIFFAVLDLVAAVGLWMIAPWGGVVWLLTVTAQIYVSAMKPGFFEGGRVFVTSLDGVLLALYLFLSWRVNRANGETSALDWLFDQSLLLARRRKSKADPSAR